MDVSKNSGTPKSSGLIGFSIIFTIHFAGNTYFFGNTHIPIPRSRNFWSSTISAEAREDKSTSEAKKKSWEFLPTSEMYDFFCVKMNLKVISCFQVVSSFFEVSRVLRIAVVNWGSIVKSVHEMVTTAMARSFLVRIHSIHDLTA